MKPFTIASITYEQAAEFVRAHHRHLPTPPPRIQIRACAAVMWKGHIRAVAMVGNPVSPHLAKTHWEVRRLASDGLWGACSALYAWSRARTEEKGRRLVTYTLASETGKSLEASGATRTGTTPGGKDCRKGRVNRLAGVEKVRWEWPVCYAH